MTLSNIENIGSRGKQSWDKSKYRVLISVHTLTISSPEMTLSETSRIRLCQKPRAIGPGSKQAWYHSKYKVLISYTCPHNIISRNDFVENNKLSDPEANSHEITVRLEFSVPGRGASQYLLQKWLRRKHWVIGSWGKRSSHQSKPMVSVPVHGLTISSLEMTLSNTLRISGPGTNTHEITVSQEFLFPY